MSDMHYVCIDMHYVCISNQATFTISQLYNNSEFWIIQYLKKFLVHSLRRPEMSHSTKSCNKTPVNTYGNPVVMQHKLDQKLEKSLLVKTSHIKKVMKDKR